LHDLFRQILDHPFDEPVQFLAAIQNGFSDPGRFQEVFSAI